MRLQVGLSGGSDEGIADLEPETIGEIHQTLDAASEAFADEIRRSIDYYHSQEPEGQIASLLITGEGALTRHMPEYLSRGPAPASHARQRAPARGREQDQAVAGRSSRRWRRRLAIAIGLALEDEE